MHNFSANVDDYVTTLWLETAGLTVFMSLSFFLMIKLFLI